MDPTAYINNRDDSPDMHEKIAERSANSANKRRQMQAAAPQYESTQDKTQGKNLNFNSEVSSQLRFETENKKKWRDETIETNDDSNALK